MKNYKRYLPQILIVAVGIVLVLMSIFADQIGIGQGPKNFGFSQWLMLIAGIVMTLIAINRQLSLLVAINLLVLIPALLLVDNVLYFTSPWLPGCVVRNLSKDAQTKYLLKHWEDMPYVIRDGGASYYKPNFIAQKKDGTYFFDEFGYRNPPGYITKFNPDVILLGDSFTEGYTKTTIAEYLRIFLSPWKAYSLGIAGQGPQHWKIQLNRYVNSIYCRSTPKIVVLNFFSGNDITDVTTCKPGKDHTNQASDKPDPPQRKFSFFGELVAMARNALYYHRVVAYAQLEPSLEEVLDPVVAQAFFESVKEIRNATAPSTIILLSYISSAEVIYGSGVDRCVSALRSLGNQGGYYREACKVAASRQLANSNFLHKLADDLKIEYLDATPALREAARKLLLHNEGLHFNDEGNRIYSEEVAEKLKELMKP